MGILFFFFIYIGFSKYKKKKRTKIITNNPQGLDKISKPTPSGIKVVNISKYNNGKIEIK